LHVLSTPPAFVLSQNQTLRKELNSKHLIPAYLNDQNRNAQKKYLTLQGFQPLLNRALLLRATHKLVFPSTWHSFCFDFRLSFLLPSYCFLQRTSVQGDKKPGCGHFCHNRLVLVSRPDRVVSCDAALYLRFSDAQLKFFNFSSTAPFCPDARLNDGFQPLPSGRFASLSGSTGITNTHFPPQGQ
jgi:hypothetical protein